ncbi:MAG: exodeoxyribonuclease V subunit beta [Venatoribacter sp.]
MSNMQPLDTLQLPLMGKVLIEASAGTGKTYSLAALYVRLVIGGSNTAFAEGLKPEQILVMTFTRAATQELRQRIRQRLAEAAAVLQGSQEAQDDFLTNLIANLPVPKNVAAERCLLASLQMDKAAIYTIHGFCQRVLQRFAFATSQPFEQDMEMNEAAILLQAYQDYWRRFIQPLQAGLVDALSQLKITTPNTLKAKVTAFIEENDLAVQAEKTDFPQSILACEANLNALARAKAQVIGLLQEQKSLLLDWLQAEIDEGNLKQSNLGKGATEALDAFMSAGTHNDKLSYFSSHGLQLKAKRHCEVPPALSCLAAMNGYLEQQEQTQFPTQDLLSHAANWTAEEFQQQLNSRSLITFNSMISALSAALNHNPNPDMAALLAKQLRSAYPCALIDEFQDTNSEQYGIFSAIYDNAASENLAWLMIGDPKQSIYGFQGADIDAYIQAKNATAANNCYTLNTNYRSSHAIIEATNHLFASSPMGQDALFGNQAIQFQQINSPKAHEPSQFALNQQSQQAGVVLCYPQSSEVYGAGESKAMLAAYFAKQTQQLLANASLKGQALKPSDITLLVRSRHQADDIKTALSQLNIDSVFLSERNSVYDSQDAIDLLSILKAIAHSGNSTQVRSALACTLLAYSWQEQQAMFQQDEKLQSILRLFRDLKVTWEKRGPLPMIHSLVHQLKLPERLQQAEGERTLTNLFHLAELLQRQAKQLDGISAQLQSYERALAEKPQGSDDNTELLIRLENERNRVQIMTLHKSKGLEFPIVMLPFVSLAASAKTPKEEHDEEMRLLYVGITRAKHACFIGFLRSKYGNVKESMVETSPLGRLLFGSEKSASDSEQVINQRLEQLCHSSQGMIALQTGVLSQASFATPSMPEPELAADTELKLELHLPKPWWVSSYSGLIKGKSSTAFTAKAEDEPDAEFDEQGHKLLSTHNFPKGRHTGNLFHALLEQCAKPSFSATVNAPEQLALLIERETRNEIWQDKQAFIATWLKQIATTSLPFGPTHLALTEASAVLAESEFWLKAPQLNLQKLTELSLAYLPRSRAPLNLSQHGLNGMLKGFIDLLVEHQGKYYVLDYKTNHLGYNDQAYSHSNLREAVLANHYDLQGLIYQQALHRLLGARLPNYRPEQHLGGSAFYFIRGINNPDSRGLFYIPANLELLTAMENLFNDAGALA